MNERPLVSAAVLRDLVRAVHEALTELEEAGLSPQEAMRVLRDATDDAWWSFDFRRRVRPDQ